MLNKSWYISRNVDHYSEENEVTEEILDMEKCSGFKFKNAFVGLFVKLLLFI